MNLLSNIYSENTVFDIKTGRLFRGGPSIFHSLRPSRGQGHPPAPLRRQRRVLHDAPDAAGAGVGAEAAADALLRVRNHGEFLAFLLLAGNRPHRAQGLAQAAVAAGAAGRALAGAGVEIVELQHARIEVLKLGPLVVDHLARVLAGTLAG